MQLSPWSPSLNLCTSKKLEVELRWPGKQDWHFLAWLHKLKTEPLFFYFLYVIAPTAWMCTSYNKTNKWANQWRRMEEDGERAIYKSPSTGRGERNKKTAMDSKKNVEITQSCFMMKKTALTLPRGWMRQRKQKPNWRRCTGERWKRVKLAGPSLSWCPEGETKGRH